MKDQKLIVAIDKPSLSEALNFCEPLSPTQCHLKVGKELFTACGPQVVDELQKRGFKVFLDLKFHDIPQTVANAVAIAADLGVWMCNVHCLGGRRMLSAAADSIAKANSDTILIGVTILTSMESSDLADLSITRSPKELVIDYSKLAHDAGLHGVVCSAQESQSIKDATSEKFLCVTPGIRPEGSERGDQRRVVTPKAAIEGGSDYIVVGRPITQSDSPVTIVQQINDQIAL